MTTYGQTITWTELDGTTHGVTVEGCATFERARGEAIRLATKQGWTPPRWWQLWRWKDTRPQLEQVEK